MKYKSMYIIYSYSYTKNMIVIRKRHVNIYFKACKNYILACTINKIKIKDIYVIYNFLYICSLCNIYA